MIAALFKGVLKGVCLSSLPAHVSFTVSPSALSVLLKHTYASPVGDLPERIKSWHLL